jgi:hypothetical protein
MGERKVYTGFWWGNVKERDNLGDPGVGKVKVTLEHATKAQRGSRCIALLFLQLRH